jgi:hypothetical protein
MDSQKRDEFFVQSLIVIVFWLKFLFYCSAAFGAFFHPCLVAFKNLPFTPKGWVIKCKKVWLFRK